ncbi:MAG TPA: hypothetical protein VE974_14990 [Thermoanaerobaculia bacterium]|nr:hypothetical protein [Thermoanaerobaculia bacterium]
MRTADPTNGTTLEEPEEQILEEMPDLETEDLQASLRFAGKEVERRRQRR